MSNEDERFVAPELQEIVNEFKQAGVYMKINVRVEDLGDKIAGYCYSYNGESYLIEINTRFLHSEAITKTTLLHEIGHCSYNLDHSKDVFDNNKCKTNVMTEYLDSVKCLESTFDYKLSYILSLNRKD